LVQFPKAELETLWAPWRFEYFEKSGTPDFLSEAARASDDAAHLVLVRRKNSFLMMNRYPYTVGHLMAVPYRKVGELRDLGENEVAELFSLVVRGQELLRQVTKAQGFNIGHQRRRMRRSGRARPPAYSHRTALEWRHEFHANAFRDARALTRTARSLSKIEGGADGVG
jgi:hypothetical protein